MPILVEDIKLLKPAVMADTTDGGGAMTGTPIVDGVSNNMFPDTSALDRANGRVQFRKPFGVAHSSDTDTLLGAHVILTEAPADPLTNVALMKAGSWAETRAAAKDRVERYVVKGPRVPARLYDAHYAGSLQIRLISFVETTFPAGGEAVVLVAPSGSEQYVRILRTAISQQELAVSEGGSVIVLKATICTCDIGQELQFDFVGPPAQRVVGEAAYAQIFSTSPSSGAKFYGLKPVGVAGAVGDLQVTVAGGIYSALVPAATVENPITDQYPLVSRTAMVKTAYTGFTLSGSAKLVGPNAVFRAAGPIEPGSLAFAFGATNFSDDGAGNLKQGTLVVGAVDYKNSQLQFAAGCPTYGTGAVTMSYRQGSVTGASSYSACFEITQGNQGLAYTNVFAPAPAPGTFQLSYMAQARWYSVRDNLAGKLEGSDSSYGVGTINYATGSMAMTLGAIPDVGSVLLAEWGTPDSAQATSPAYLPSKVCMEIALDAKTKAEGITVAWSRAGTNYTATTNAAGALTGSATGSYSAGMLRFEPAVFPDVAITVTSQTAPVANTGITGSAGAYTLTGPLPAIPGSFKGSILATYPADVINSVPALPVWDAGGVLYTSIDNQRGGATVIGVGTINYGTGAITTVGSGNFFTWLQNNISLVANTWQYGVGAGALVVNGFKSVVVSLGALTGVSYSSGATTTDVQTIAPGPWIGQIATMGMPNLVTGTAFALGGSMYTADSGLLRRGWDVSLGTPEFAAAGSFSSDGRFSIPQTALPLTFANGITWYNNAQDAAAKQVDNGVFRTASSPLKTGVFQMQANSHIGSANDAGVISGYFGGKVDYQRGLVRWTASGFINPASLSYNAVFLQYLPLDGALLGLDTARLPLDGRVPIFRAGDDLLIHNTQVFDLPGTLVKNTVYNMGRERLASVKVKDALGVTVPTTKYTTDLDAGTIVFPTASDITPYTQPFKAHHRIEDMVICLQADISGALKFSPRLTHVFPAGSSFVSSMLIFGDVFARAFNFFEQQTWASQWLDAPVGAPITARYNNTLFPVVVTNRGAITERWALIFTSATSFRIVGETVGDIGTGTTGVDTAPVNPSVTAPYWVLSAAGLGNGWAVGNVLRFNTSACGAPFWILRTTLQGASLQSDRFTTAFRGDIDRP